jgi:2-phospho-L-lactate guanylyltransferase
VLLVPGDCPLANPYDLAALIAHPAPPPSALIVPDRHGTGTNGLLLAPPGAITPSFGIGSCERHRALAIAAEISWRIERPASLLLDIDTREDLDALRARLSAERLGTSRTRAVLDRTAAKARSVITTSA